MAHIVTVAISAHHGEVNVTIGGETIAFDPQYARMLAERLKASSIQAALQVQIAG